MKPSIARALSLILLAALLGACEKEATAIPSDTPPPPTATNTMPPTPLPPTPTQTATASPIPPTATNTQQQTQIYTPVNTLAVSPTPRPGWITYSNDFLGYGFNYPAGGSIDERGPAGMDVNEVLPPGFTFSEYFDYVMAILPDKLCVSVAVPGAYITIAPPYPFGSYVGPCPGMGIGTGYRFESATETLYIAGREYTNVIGHKLYLESTGAFYAEFYRFDLENGFRVMFNGKPAEGMSYDDYLVQRAAGFEIIATLHWFRIPDLTKPGTTCAGKFTRLVPTVYAVVSGESGDPPNRVRSGPSTSDEVIAQIYPGTIVKVLEGPVCADGMVFWKVENAAIPGGSGWTAEGDGLEYWLEPYIP